MLTRRPNSKTIMVFIGGFLLMLIGAVIATVAPFVPVWIPVLIAVAGFIIAFLTFPY